MDKDYYLYLVFPLLMSSSKEKKINKFAALEF